MPARRWIPYAFLAPALLGLLIFRFTPICLSLIGSFFGQSIRGDSIFVGTKNYAELLGDPAFWSAVWTTLIFNLVINPFQVVCALALAMLVRRPTRFIDVFRASFCCR